MVCCPGIPSAKYLWALLPSLGPAFSCNNPISRLPLGTPRRIGLGSRSLQSLERKVISGLKQRVHELCLLSHCCRAKTLRLLYLLHNHLQPSQRLLILIQTKLHSLKHLMLLISKWCILRWIIHCRASYRYHNGKTSNYPLWTLPRLLQVPVPLHPLRVSLSQELLGRTRTAAVIVT